MTDEIPDSETMLRELHARQKIHDAIIRYCRGVDHRDESLIRSAYHPDAMDERGVFKGSVEDYIPRTLTGNPDIVNKRHAICNEYVEFDEIDPNTAYSESVVIGCMVRRGGDNYILSFSSCRYLDRFECRNGDWRIIDRKVVLDWEFNTPSTGNEGTQLTTGMLRGLFSPSDPSFGLGFRRWSDKPPVPVSEERTKGVGNY